MEGGGSKRPDRQRELPNVVNERGRSLGGLWHPAPKHCAKIGPTPSAWCHREEGSWAAGAPYGHLNQTFESIFLNERLIQTFETVIREHTLAMPVMTITSNDPRAGVSGTQRKSGQLGMNDRDCLSKSGYLLPLACATFFNKKWRIDECQKEKRPAHLRGVPVPFSSTAG